MLSADDAERVRGGLLASMPADDADTGDATVGAADPSPLDVAVSFGMNGLRRLIRSA